MGCNYIGMRTILDTGERCYEDFISKRITIKINAFDFNSEFDALKHELIHRIINHVPYQNGLCCDFSHIKLTYNTDSITISANVESCEVDC